MTDSLSGKAIMEPQQDNSSETRRKFLAIANTCMMPLIRASDAGQHIPAIKPSEPEPQQPRP
jgi:hypothetical protein